MKKNINLIITLILIFVLSITTIVLIEKCKHEKELQRELSLSNFQKNHYMSLYKCSINDNKELLNKLDSEINKVNVIKKQIAVSNDNERLSRGDFASKDLRKDYVCSIPQLNKWIADRAPSGSPFIGNASVFIEASQETGLDPRYIIAHAALESKWGMSDIAQNKYNYFGINAQNANPNKAYSMSDNMKDGILAGAKWIKNNYTDKGQYSLNLMIYGNKAYCQHGDGTPSQAWIDKIVNIITK